MKTPAAHMYEWVQTDDGRLIYRKKEKYRFQPKIYGVAPTVIFDEMPETYHEAAQVKVSSRSEWERLDKQHNTLTFGSLEASKPKVDQANLEKAKKAELRKASKTALDKYRANPKEVSQMLRKREQEQMEVVEKTPGLKQLLEKTGVKI
jgi:hydroxymethylpyrimidine pyrophosphatase-like HAD family hydrolase